jgi:hypothetical protein
MPSTTVWFCCNCGFGPCNVSIDYFCPSCQEKRCYNCKTSKISNRYNYALPGEAEANPFPEVSTAARFNPNTYNISPSPRPFTLPHQQLEVASLALAPTQIPPICLHAGHQHSTDGPSIGEIFQHGGLINSCPVKYYCCNCGDGPKLYANQPVCVSCHHHVCSYCETA